MTPEQQRIAIAEACGWTDVSDWGAAGINGRHPPEPWVEVIPDYLNDLNAMHEAEKVMTGPQRDQYYDRLIWFGPPHFATAAQRSEAFLKALDLWKETT